MLADTLDWNFLWQGLQTQGECISQVAARLQGEPRKPSEWRQRWRNMTQRSWARPGGFPQWRWAARNVIFSNWEPVWPQLGFVYRSCKGTEFKLELSLSGKRLVWLAQNPGSIGAPHKQGVAVHTCNSRTPSRVRRSEVQGHPLLQVWDHPGIHENLSQKRKEEIKHSRSMLLMVKGNGWN